MIGCGFIKESIGFVWYRWDFVIVRVEEFFENK